MTRINCIPVGLLIDQHLLAEYREITRVQKQARSLSAAIPTYRLGKGHVKFFYDKGMYLAVRTHELWNECLDRGFQVEYKDYGLHPRELNNGWEPTAQDLQVNLIRLDGRIKEMKRDPLFGRLPASRQYYRTLLIALQAEEGDRYVEASSR